MKCKTIIIPIVMYSVSWIPSRVRNVLPVMQLYYFLLLTCSVVKVMVSCVLVHAFQSIMNFVLYTNVTSLSLSLSFFVRLSVYISIYLDIHVKCISPMAWREVLSSHNCIVLDQIFPIESLKFIITLECSYLQKI